MAGSNPSKGASMVGSQSPGDINRIVSSYRSSARRAQLYTVLVSVSLAGLGVAYGFHASRQNQQLKAAGLQTKAADLKVTQSSRVISYLAEPDENIQQAAATDVNSPAAQIALGVARARKGDWVGAIQAYDQALALDPKNAIALNLKGYAQIRNKQPAAAVETLGSSVAADPTYVWGHYNLALAYLRNGQTPDALSEIKSTIQTDPSFKQKFLNDGQFSSLAKNPQFISLTESH